MKLAYKYRAYPTLATAEFLQHGMIVCKDIYNACIFERRQAWFERKGKVNQKDQQHRIKIWRKKFVDVAALPIVWLEESVKKADIRFQQFFKARKSGRKNPYPDAIKWGDSVRFGRARHFRLDGNRFVGEKLPEPIPFVLHRPLPSVPSSCTIKQEKDGTWWLAFGVEIIEPLSSAAAESVGIDLGLHNTIAVSDGRMFNLPKFVGLTKKIKRYQRKLARQKKGSTRRLETKRLLAKHSARLARMKEQWLHNQTAQLATNNVAHEDLNLAGLHRGFLSRQFQQVPLGKIIQQISYKTKLKGTVAVPVNPAGTSQTCVCGFSVPKKLSQRIHHCTACGSLTDRDTMSAMVVLARSGLADINGIQSRKMPLSANPTQNVANLGGLTPVSGFATNKLSNASDVVETKHPSKRLPSRV